MQQPELSLIEFQNKFPNEKRCLRHLFNTRWPDGYQCPRCGHDKASYHSTRHLYQCKACQYQTSIIAGTIFHKTRVPLRKWFWMIMFMGRYKSGVSIRNLQKMLKIGTYKTAWLMAHKIRHAMSTRDAEYQLAGLIEIDDSYFGGSKPGKRGRGAGGKSKVVLAVENKNDHPGFAKAYQTPHLDRESIKSRFQGHFKKDSVIRSDGWRSYNALASDSVFHESVIGSGENGARNLPWVHLLISNIKGGLRGVYRGVSSKHLSRYLAEFCYRFNRRSWENQMFDRLLFACTSSKTITYAELSQ
jgi:transposase-like protein